MDVDGVCHMRPCRLRIFITAGSNAARAVKTSENLVVASQFTSHAAGPKRTGTTQHSLHSSPQPLGGSNCLP